jgi:hypothetical protein
VLSNRQFLFTSQTVVTRNVQFYNDLYQLSVLLRRWLFWLSRLLVKLPIFRIFCSFCSNSLCHQSCVLSQGNSGSVTLEMISPFWWQNCCFDSYIFPIFKQRFGVFLYESLHCLRQCTPLKINCGIRIWKSKLPFLIGSCIVAFIKRSVWLCVVSVVQRIWLCCEVYVYLQFIVVC